MNNGLNKLLASKKGKIILSILLIVYVLYTRIYESSGGSNNPIFGTSPQSSETLEGERLVYTKHAKCRMGCRQISKQEVEFVRDQGKVNQRKSNPSSKPCPTQSREARSSDGQLIRVVFADCPQNLKVITVIDLENKYQCSCK